MRALGLGLPYNKYILLTKREVKMAGYWPSSLFAFLWTETKLGRHKTKIIFSVLFMPYNKSLIGQASSVKVAGYWPSSLFAFFMDLDFVSVHKNAKRELGRS